VKGWMTPDVLFDGLCLGGLPAYNLAGAPFPPSAWAPRADSAALIADRLQKVQEGSMAMYKILVVHDQPEVRETL
jgi:hypothetical protein